ncbi:MAG: DUF1345 domain-containing protein [Gammaproteobacteria bacterium]|nr:DUF1345 domain-containing protein [Gammaproteobacteria bacterium]MBV8403318.1 DUF1345 domain-containing protein [Gammaproteobacteria bacterium]
MGHLRNATVRHTRLWLGTIAGVVMFLAAPAQWSLLARLLTAWNVGVLLFLILVYSWMLGLDARRIHARYQDDDPSAPVILLIVTIAAVASLAAILAFLATVKHATSTERVLHVSLATATVVDSWILVATMFTLHYASMFYRALEDPPLQFPQTPQPVFGDFIYFSFTIAAACQTSDVYTRHLAIRRVVTAQTLISFLFNVSILGFAVNVSAGLLGG